MRLKEEGGGAGRSHSYLCDAHLKNAKPAIPKKEKQEAGSEDKLEPAPTLDQKLEDVETLLVQNPNVNAATFLNLLKAKGFVIERPKASAEPKQESIVTQPALARDGAKKESIKESIRIYEAASGGGTNDNGKPRYQNRFKAVLIQEGLGNTKDGYYYTKEALKYAAGAGVFEGKKFYADHPSTFEDQTRPERSVKDAYGHFENVQYFEAEDGTGQLQGDIVVLTSEDADWVRSRLMHAIDYTKKYPDKDFVGLSINANGDASPVDAAEYLESGAVVQSAKDKLKQAISEGLSEVKVVNKIDSAISCDLVTEAGAKGKVLQLLEANRMEKHEAKKEAEEKKKEADAHDDEEQDKALIKDELKKHGLIKDENGEKSDKEAPAEEEAEEKKEAEEAEEAHHEAEEKHDESEAMVQAGLHYHREFKKLGHDAKEAASRAVEAMVCAKGAHEAMEAHKKEAAKEDECKEAEEKKESKKEAEEKHKESAAVVKESDEVIKLKGENASLKDKLAKIETEQYLEKKLRESKLPMAVTKKFKESTKSFKNQKDVDEKFTLFMEGYKAVGGEADTLDAFVMTEKQPVDAEAGISLDDCVEE